MKVTLRKMGNSRGVIIPKPLLQQTGLSDELELTVEGESIILSKARNHPRENWAAASLSIAETGDDQPVWPEFTNEDDEDLTW